MMQNHFPQSKATHSLSVYFLNIDQNCARNQNLKKVSCSTVLSLAYQSLGVVYGDLNTSPLYVYKTTFSGKLSLHEDDEKIYGVLSFIFWTFTLIALFKYIFIVISANDNGEGVEAMFADLGHFSPLSIKWAYLLVNLQLLMKFLNLLRDLSLRQVSVTTQKIFCWI
ncbi:hypothetical protein ACSBR1_017272 [Camellia fascicularis]